MAEQIASAEFKEKVIDAAEPVLVDFFATWCGPCKMMAPVVDEVAGELSGKAKVYKLDIDESPEIAKEFDVMGVPTFIVFKDGEAHGRAVGITPKESLLGLFD